MSLPWEGTVTDWLRYRLLKKSGMVTDGERLAEGNWYEPFVQLMKNRLWMGSFWDLGIDRARHLEAQRLVFTTLNGLALERILVPAVTDIERDLARLTRGVTEVLLSEPCGLAEGDDS